MDATTSSTVPPKDRTIPLLGLAAAGAFLFICVSALFVYNTTRRMVAARDWQDHSQEVLTTLQATLQRLERIDYASRLYNTTKNEDDLAVTQSTVIALETGGAHLEELVKDSVVQAPRAQSMHQCVQNLKQQIHEVLPQNGSVSAYLLECRGYVSRMQESERTLLAGRIADSQRSLYRNLLAGIFFLFISLAVTMTLFGMLLRDAYRRQKADRQISRTNAQLEDTIHTLEKRAAEAALLTSAREELQLCTIPSQAQLVVVRYCKQLLPATEIALLLINNSLQMVEIAVGSETETKILDGFSLDSCCGLRSGRLRWRKPGYSEIHCNHFIGEAPENYLCLPLAAHGETLGILYLEPPTPEVSDEIEHHLESLEELAEMASMSIASLNLRARLEHQSIRDGLTNLFNRHFMEISLDREVRRAARKRTELSVLMLDVDHFKLFNDTYGHEAGDLILRAIADIFRQSVRAEDMTCRYGGEEFIIILPDTTQLAAFDRAEEIRRLISDMRIRFRAETLREVTVSIGVTTYPQNGNTLEEIMRAADRALYAAKHRGRNQVVMADSVVAAL